LLTVDRSVDDHFKKICLVPTDCLYSVQGEVDHTQDCEVLIQVTVNDNFIQQIEDLISLLSNRNCFAESRGSSVSVQTGLWAGRTGFNSWQGQ
jgi:hypothetical protein